MKRTTALTFGLVVAAMLAVPIVGAAATGGDVVAQTNGTNNTNDTNGTVSPGERLSGIVGVQGAELEGEVDKRTFGLKVARAASDDARAQVVNEQLGDIQKRLENLSAQSMALDEARENGSLSQGEYAARVSELAARGQVAKDLTNETNRTAGTLPAEVLEANGVNVSAIQQLKNNANNLTGPEVAQIARSIAGPNVGEAPEDIPVGGPEDAGPDGDRGQAGNATDGESTETPDGTTTQDGTETATESGTDSDSDAGDSGSGGGNNR